jgi:hypothetical protein
MIRFAADEDFNNDVVRALRRALPEVNIVGVREAGRGGHPDPEVLAWAAAEARVLLTHDVTTMTRHALERVARGEPMPGVIAVHQRLPIGHVVDDLLLVASCSLPTDWVNRVGFLPLR